MKYIGMPAGMWLLFVGSFRRQLTKTLGFEASRAKEITTLAKRKYKWILRGLPAFEKGDRFKMNIISCAMLSAFLLEMPEKPTVDQVADYYRDAMTTGAMKVFCRMGGKRKFTRKDIEGMKKTAALNAADRNGFTEGCNNAIKALKRVAFGFRSFHSLRARILLSMPPHPNI